MLKYLFILFSLCALGCSPPAGQSSDAPGPISLDPAHIRANTLYFQIMYNEHPAGSMKVDCVREPQGWLVEEHTTLDANSNQEIIRTRMDHAFRPLVHEVRGRLEGNELDVQVHWEGDRVDGHSLFPRPPHKQQGKITIERTLPVGTFERTATFYLLPAMPLSDQARFTFNWFNTLYAEVNPIQLEVKGIVQTTVPAGTFDTYKVRLLGADPNQTIYVSTESPRKVVKIEVDGLPWRFELM
ncbi:MAG: hypothetical protein AAF206_03105 [Bacteroidota bacterium]